MTLIDSLSREINYLRISITDRCNFRCEYCKPFDSFEHFPKEDLLSIEEITEMTRVFVSKGIKKVRLTGGEPLIRKGVEKLVRSFSKMEGLQDIALSTNGAKLPEKAQELADSGLHRINISLDTLNPDKFKQMTKVDYLDEVIDGIHKSLAVGFKTVKINVVLIRGFNDDELSQFLDFAVKHPVEIRFIELMPSRNCYQRGEEQFLPNEVAKKILNQERRLTPTNDFSSVAQIYSIENGLGKIGFISPMSDSFCDRCNRLRLTATGMLRLCLHSETTIDLKKIIRSANYRSMDLERSIEAALLLKPKGQILTQRSKEKIALKMSQVGG